MCFSYVYLNVLNKINNMINVVCKLKRFNQIIICIKCTIYILSV